MEPQSLSLTHLVAPPKQEVDRGSSPPLLVLLHGVGSNEQDLFSLAQYLDPRFLIVSVRAPNTLGYGAYAWYPLEWTAQGPVGDPNKAEASRRALLQFLPEAATAYNADPDRIVLMGFSQGAIMSLFVALTEPEEVAALVPMSGRLLPEAWEHRASNERLTGLPVCAVHGVRDTVLPVRDGRLIRDRLSTLPVDLTYHEYDMAHEVSGESLRDISAWLTAWLDREP